jgi:hypothetical protein
MTRANAEAHKRRGCLCEQGLSTIPSVPFQPVEQKSGVRIHDLFHLVDSRHDALKGSPALGTATTALILRLVLSDRGHRLSGHPGKGLNFSFQGEHLGGKFSVLDGVPIALGSPAGGPVHPADLRPSNRRRAAL